MTKLEEVFHNSDILRDSEYVLVDVETAKRIQLFVGPEDYEQYEPDEYSDEKISFRIDDLPFIFTDLQLSIESIVFSEDLVYKELFVISKNRVIDFSWFHRCIYEWKELLSTLCDKKFESGQGEEYLVINPWSSVDGSEIFNLNDVVNFDDEKIENILKAISSPHILIDILNERDAHSNERKATLKKSLVECFKDIGSKDLAWLLCNAEELDKAYRQDYEVYLRAFSFKEFNERVDDELRKIIEKCTEQVHSFQLQSFAVPVVVVLSSIARTGEKKMTLALIFGFILATLLLWRSFKSKRDAIKTSTSSSIKSLQVYRRRLSEETSNTSHPLLEIIDDSIEQVSEIKRTSLLEVYRVGAIICCVTILYILAAIIFGTF